MTCHRYRTLVSCIRCLAELFLSEERDTTDAARVLPLRGRCPLCARELFWGDLIREWRNLPRDRSGNPLTPGYL
eukprot:m.549282 g.549282  ORF g.549282 m.549282 type:complete len:74 (+) comp22158_c1_seq110:1594-1815(+)